MKAPRARGIALQRGSPPTLAQLSELRLRTLRMVMLHGDDKARVAACREVRESTTKHPQVNDLETMSASDLDALEAEAKASLGERMQ